MASRLKKGAAAAGIAVALIGGFEGLRTVAYRDVVGVWTACYGATKDIRPGMKFTREQCDDMLIEDIERHELGMRRCMRDPDGVPIQSYIAFTSFTYNLGVGAFCKSTLRKKLDRGDLKGACDELLKWTRAGGKVWRGLVRRRGVEHEFCLKGLGQ